MLVLTLNGCATLRDSLILGTGSGAVIGGVIGSQARGDKSENAIKGAVIGGAVLGLASYVIHNSLEKRDERVRRETLFNLDHYEVMGFDGQRVFSSEGRARSGKCFTTKEVDGRVVSIPCGLVNDSDESEAAKP